MANALLQQQGLLGKFILLPMHVSFSGIAKVLVGLRHLGEWQNEADADLRLLTLLFGRTGSTIREGAVRARRLTGWR